MKVDLYPTSYQRRHAVGAANEPATQAPAMCVEIPASWDDARYWPGRRIDTQAAAEIDSPLREAGRRAPIFAERLAEALDDHRVTRERDAALALRGRLASP